MTKEMIDYSILQTHLSEEDYEAALRYVQRELKNKANDPLLLTSASILCFVLGKKEEACLYGDSIPLNAKQLGDIAPFVLEMQVVISYCLEEYSKAFETTDIALKLIKDKDSERFLAYKFFISQKTDKVGSLVKILQEHFKLYSFWKEQVATGRNQQEKPPIVDTFINVASSLFYDRSNKVDKEIIDLEEKVKSEKNRKSKLGYQKRIRELNRWKEKNKALSLSYDGLLIGQRLDTSRLLKIRRNDPILVYVIQGKMTQAFLSMNRLLERSPKNADLWYKKAVLEALTGEYEEAVKSVLRSLQFDRSSAQIISDKIRFLLMFAEERRIPKILSSLERLLSIRVRDDPSYNEIYAQILVLMRRRLSDAYNSLETLKIDELENGAEISNEMGVVAMQLKKYNEAFSHFQGALSLKMMEIVRNLGLAAFALNKNDFGLKAFTKYFSSLVDLETMCFPQMLVEFLNDQLKMTKSGELTDEELLGDMTKDIEKKLISELDEGIIIESGQVEEEKASLEEYLTEDAELDDETLSELDEIERDITDGSS